MRLSGGSLFRTILAGILTVTGIIAIPMAARSAETSGAVVAASPAHEHHQEIRKAIKKLEAAKADLQHAAHDFGGHRIKAVQAVEQALAELRLALQFDK